MRRTCQKSADRGCKRASDHDLLVRFDMRDPPNWSVLFETA